MYPVTPYEAIFTASNPDSRGRYQVKTLWVAHQDFSGSILIRGMRLLLHRVPLSFSGRYDSELRLSTTGVHLAPTQSWYEWGSFTYVTSRWCYSWQIDVAGKTEHVVFEVTIG